MKYILTGFFIAIGLAACVQQNDFIKEGSKTAANVKAHFVEDDRLEVFQASFSRHDDGLVVKGKTNLPEAKAALLDSLKQTDAQVIDSIRVLPDENLEHGNALIALSTSNIRSRPSHPATLVTQGVMGTPVKVLEKQGSWYHIRTPDRYLGWIDEAGITLKSETEMEQWKETQKVIFHNNFGYVYAENNTTAPTISDITLGNILKMEEETGSWYKVVLPEGKKGYVLKSATEKMSEWLTSMEVTGESLEKTARSFLGFPYLWGGTSSKGVDCSGFTKMIYLMHGIILQRDASQQTLYGKEISLDNNYAALKNGDLLFFGQKAGAGREERVTHVGMYIGNKAFIHAAGKVRINSLSPESENYSHYRKLSLVRARRILGYTEGKGIKHVENHPFYQKTF